MFKRTRYERQDKTVYISGPITTNPEGWRECFDQAYAYLKSEGYAVVHNPREIGDSLDATFQALGKRPKYGDYMRADLRMLLRCDVIYMLKGWEDSAGARVELSVAQAVGMEVMYEA